jgi:hypothetical protein
MKRSRVVSCIFVLTLLIGAGTFSLQRIQAQGRGNPEAAAARERQLSLEKETLQLEITEEVLPLSIPGHTVGETEGISKNSKALKPRRSDPIGLGRSAAIPASVWRVAPHNRPFKLTALRSNWIYRSPDVYAAQSGRDRIDFTGGFERR